jgi:hypothetical protein
MWCNPNDIQLATKYFNKKPAKYVVSGTEFDAVLIKQDIEHFVSGSNWDCEVTSIDNISLIDRCKKRYLENKSWEEVGEYDWMLANISYFGEQDECKTFDDVKKRCTALDNLEHTLKQDQKLLTRRELQKITFREKGGIGIGVDRSGNLIWMEGGAHRLAIAQALGLKEIPVSLVIVHTEALIKKRVERFLRKTCTDEHN